jgi:hypothetical protein
MATTSVPKEFIAIDVSGQSRPWYKDATGAFRPMPAKAGAIGMLAAGGNYIGGRQPRLLFSQARTPTQVSATGSDPLYVFSFDDVVENATSQTWRILAMPRSAGTGTAYAGKESSSEQTEDYTTAAITSNFPENVFYQQFTVDRAGGWTAVEDIEQGLSTFNGYKILDIAIEENPRSFMTNGTDQVIPTPTPGSGREIIETDPNTIQDVIHAVRSTNLGMAFWYSSTCVSGTWATPGSTDSSAIVTTSTSFVNILDQTVSARTATSPGITAIVQYCGRGEYGGGTALLDNDGASVRVKCRVFGASVSDDCEVKFIGSDHISGNEATATITAGGSGAWFDADDFIYLNSTVGGDDATTARNKIDIHFKMNSAGTAYVYALAGPINYF